MTLDQNADALRRKQAAMFVDYDNLYTILQSQSEHSRSAGEYAEEIFEEVRRYLEEGDDTPTIFGRAYGTFETLLDDEDAQVLSVLQQRGIEPVHVPTAVGMQENTSEVRLTLELTNFLTRRSDVQTLVIVTGNRPYLPLVRWIREQGCRPLVAAVNPPQTADTPAFVEDSKYLDARNLLSQNSREDLLSNAPTSGAAYTRAQTPEDPPPQQFQPLDAPAARRAVEITEEHFGQYDEVYLTPLLRKLSDLMGPDQDPKSLVSELEAAGAARLEKRNGYPYNYTVLIVNDDHPDVQEVHETVDGASPSEAEPTSDAPAEDERVEENESSSHDEYETEDAFKSPTAPTSVATENGDDSASFDEPEEEQ
jgi:hypothetical protein